MVLVLVLALSSCRAGRRCGAVGGVLRAANQQDTCRTALRKGFQWAPGVASLPRPFPIPAHSPPQPQTHLLATAQASSLAARPSTSYPPHSPGVPLSQQRNPLPQPRCFTLPTAQPPSHSPGVPLPHEQRKPHPAQPPPRSHLLATALTSSMHLVCTNGSSSAARLPCSGMKQAQGETLGIAHRKTAQASNAVQCVYQAK